MPCWKEREKGGSGCIGWLAGHDFGLLASLVQEKKNSRIFSSLIKKEGGNKIRVLAAFEKECSFSCDFQGVLVASNLACHKVKQS